jgi:hypothetical protein
MAEGQSCWVIRSVREDGQRFRPSDWIERISASMAQFGPDRRLRYASSVYPRVIDGEKCLVVTGTLAEQRPALYEHILEFARSNQLQSEQGPCMAA